MTYDADQQARLERLRAVLSPQDFAALQAGQRALEWARHNHHGAAQPETIKVNLPEPEPKRANPYGKAIKIWPSVILAAIKAKTGGAARLYFLARSLDQTGRGMVYDGDLHSLLRDLRVERRTRERWQRQAFELGILRKVRSRGLPMVQIVSLGRAAVALGCDRVGLPATMGDAALTGKGWRSWLWAAYLTTTKGRPISQLTKAELTGVKPRTQRNYQSDVPGERIRNHRRVYLDGSRSNRSKQANGLREVQGMVVFENKRGQAIQVLPDGRKVPDFVSRLQPRGNSRKAQRLVNHQNKPSLFPERRSCDGGQRLFCEGERQVKAAIRHASEAAPWERPKVVFELAKVVDRGRVQVNQWCAHEV